MSFEEFKKETKELLEKFYSIKSNAEEVRKIVDGIEDVYYKELYDYELTPEQASNILESGL